MATIPEADGVDGKDDKIPVVVIDDDRMSRTSVSAFPVVEAAPLGRSREFLRPPPSTCRHCRLRMV